MALLDIKGLKKTYISKYSKEEIQALKDINFSVDKGEFIAIMGESGSGKTTLLNLLAMFDKPTNGNILLEGRDFKDIGENEMTKFRRDNLGYIFQEFNLLDTFNICDNILLPLVLSGKSFEEMEKSLKPVVEQLKLEPLLKKYPFELSGGQKQRVAIARALANDPDVLLCDEATSALDPQTTKSILALLKKLNNTLGLTIVIITHEMAVVKEVCDKVAVMENGKVVESGSVFSIFANPKEAVTRDFIRTTSNLHKIDDLINDHANVVALKPGELIVRLSYVESNTSEPLISTVSRKFNIDVNIIYADVEIIKDAPIGGTVAIINGKREDISEAVLYLLDKNVHVEVLKDARISN